MHANMIPPAFVGISLRAFYYMLSVIQIDESNSFIRHGAVQVQSQRISQDIHISQKQTHICWAIYFRESLYKKLLQPLPWNMIMINCLLIVTSESIVSYGVLSFPLYYPLFSKINYPLSPRKTKRISKIYEIMKFSQ